MIASLLDSYATAVRPKFSQDAAQGNQRDYTVGNPGVTIMFQNRPCSYQEADGSLVFRYAQRQLDVSNVLYFTQDPGNLNECLITLTRPKTGDVLYLNYVGQADPFQWGMTWVWPIHALRVRQPGS
jgi:hypothetical protein